MSHPVFWRDPALPHVELRKVDDGRTVCYAPHAHAEWSLGAIVGGESSFVCGRRSYHVEAGTLVLINPESVHACNPVEGRPWAYLMLYVDANWLAGLRCRLGFARTRVWEDLSPDVSREPAVFDAFTGLAACLLDPALSASAKNARLVAFLAGLMPRLSARGAARKPPAQLRAVADYLDAHCAEEVSIDALCRQAGLSPGHLIRCFKQHFRLTPHAYAINRRVQLGQRALRRGQPIADAALESGFADQPHFQRVFKRLLAAMPRQYRRISVDQQEDATAREQDGEHAVQRA
ncbi:AraC family transcriptional regulator [Thauera butanivorans]|uniref:AraC family transcriptional regulator n=1 Tax=Thauera butanivorans TaxID=86174 RepID=UPI000837DA58|nr:AraC family transcriptional regulator [Thauera butanivorans]